MEVVKGKTVVKVTEEEMGVIRKFCEIMLEVYDEKNRLDFLDEPMEDIVDGRKELEDISFKIAET